ncbi:MAG: Tol biopolymer transport system component/DNA-binding winged helix-turn-helix (wHTH) protein [Phenylobacterium sp.]|jgi:Tol biopolymer transport system component/DNA-binding winged helix-turn-helix (wHTH) protein
MNPILAPAISQPCQFADWQFDPSDGQLNCANTHDSDNKKSVRLQPRLSTLLAVMLANVDVVLPREALIEILWAEKMVNEDALSRCIAQLRSALGDDRQSPIYIETIPKKGYRFIQPLVQKVADNKASKTRYRGVAIALVAVVFIGLLFNYQPAPSADVAIGLKSALIEAKRVTADSEVEYQPQLSHRGDKLVFAVRQDKRLMVKIIAVAGAVEGIAEGTVLHQIKDPEQHLYSATFSADDQSLLIAGLGPEGCTIYLYQLPLLQREALGQCIAPSMSGIFAWSGGGNSFAYVARGQKSETQSERKEKGSAIWRYDFNTKQHQQISWPTRLNVYDTNPRYSPDGQQLGFTRGTKSIRNIHAMDTTSNEVSAVTHGKGFTAGFEWLNDNRHLVFDSNGAGDRSLWLVDSHTGKQQLLGARDGQYPSLNRDNNRLAFQEIRYNANIWQVDLDQADSKPKQIIESIRYNNFPVWSPDGKTIAFSSNRQGKSVIWLYSVVSQKQTKLLGLPDVDLISPSWSADGSQLLVSSRGADGYHCYQVEANSGQYQPVRGFSSDHYGCVYSAKGDIFALTKVPQQPSLLLKLSVDGQQILTEHSVARVEVTTDDRLIYSLPDKDGLYSMDFAGENKTTVLADFSHRLDEHWAVRDNLLYYPKTAEQERGIWQRDLATGVEHRVSTQMPSAIGLTLSISPDHVQMVFSQTDSRKSDIYMAQLPTLE